MHSKPSSRRSSEEADRARFKLGREIESARLEKNWSQTDLGGRVDLSQKTVSRIELGEMSTMGTGQSSRVTGIGIGLAIEFDKAFGLPPGTLASRAGYLPPLDHSVERTIPHDPNLDEDAQEVLKCVYRHLVKRKVQASTLDPSSMPISFYLINSEDS